MGFFLMLLLYAALFVLSDLLLPKPDIEDAKPLGIGDFQFPTATEERSVPLGWGTFRIKGPNVVWTGDFRKDAITEEIKTGLFTSENVVTGYRYFVGIQFALMEGVVDELRKMWIGDELVFDGSVTHDTTFTINEPRLFGGDEAGGAGGFRGTFRFFAGTNTQAPSSYLSEKHVAGATIVDDGAGYSVNDVLIVQGGTFLLQARIRVTAQSGGNITAFLIQNPGDYTAFPSNPVSVSGGTGTGAMFDLILEGFASIGGQTIAYRDICYIIPDEEAPYVGNSGSIKPPSFEVRRTPNFLSLTGGREIVNDGDANPMNVLYEVLTNASWGFGIAAADVDVAVFVTAANTIHAEGNGFSFMLDREEDAGEFVRRIEQQVDCITFLNPATAKWQVKLIRDDYDILLVPEINATNSELESFTQGTWEGTTNQVRCNFNERVDDYKGTYAFAQDQANVRIVGSNTSTTVTHPGVKDRDLANSLTWRELRTLAYPLSSGGWILNRTMYGVLPGDVLALTDADLGYTRLPMRVMSVDYGELLDGRIRISAVRDVFRAAVGSFAAPPSTTWEPPADELVAFPPDEQLAFEAPRGLTLRDPNSPAPDTDKIYAAARRQGPESSFLIVERHAAGTPSGAFTEVGEVFGFLRIGSLLSTLPSGRSYPHASFVVVPGPDTQSAIETAFPDITDIVELGTDLLTLCLIDEEFFLVSSAQNSGLNVQLNNVYSGVLDSPQDEHLAGAFVYLLFLGGGMSRDTVPAGQNVHVKLLPRSASADLAEADAIQVAFAMEDRTRRPYPPSELDLNGTRFAASTSLEGSGSGEGIGILLDFARRDFRATDEVAQLGVDAGAIFADFPTANSTTHEVEVVDDPSGTPVSLFTQSLGSGVSGTITRLAILQATDGVLPTSLRFRLRAIHDFGGLSYESRRDLVWDFAVTSALTGQFGFGALDTNEVSAAFTVDDDTQNHVFTLSSAFTAGDVQYRINAGTFTTVIAAGMTTGSILAALLNNGDTIEIRHQSTDVGALKLVTMSDGSPAAFGVLYV